MRVAPILRSLLRPAPGIALALLAAASCAKTSSCGCLGAIAPLPKPLDRAHTVEDGAQAFLSPSGLNFLDQNVATLVGNMLPGGLTFWVPEMSGNKKACVFGLCVTEYEYWVCRAQDCPFSGDPAACTNSGAAPGGACPIAAKLDNLKINAVAPNSLDATLSMDIDWHEYGFANGSCQEGAAGPACRNTIWINGDVLSGLFNVSCDTPGIQLTIDGKTLSIDLQLTIDPITQALGVNIESVNGLSFSSNDIHVSCGIEGDIINFVLPYVTGILNSQVQSMMQSTIGKQLDKQFCMPQNFYSAVTCPASLSGVQSMPGTDQNGDPVCCAPGTQCASGGGPGCIVKPLGLVGVADVASFLSKFGAPPAADLGLELFPGQDQPPASAPLVERGGLQVRVVTGAQALSPSDCVPKVAPPPAPAQTDINFDNEAKTAGIPSYMVGIGLSGAFLNQAGYEAYNAGALCLDVNSYNESLLNTQLLTPILPSLAYIAPDDALYAVLRPQNPPQFAIGAGTLKNGQIVDPLLTLSMKDLRIDMFATVDERPVRLFSISSDVSMPLALAVGANGTSIEVVLGDMSKLLVNLNATSTNILAESPQQLLKLIPLVLNLAGPALAKMPSFSLPALQGFGLSLFPGDAGVPGIHGIVPAGDGGYEDIGIFADLNTGTASGAIVEGGIPPAITIVENREPPLSDVAPGGTLTFWPTAVAQIDQGGGPTEASWSVDDGLWTAWERGATVEVTSPNFLLQGHHAIRFRTRVLGDEGPGVSQTVDFIADYTPPELDLGIDQQGRFTLSAKDNVTPSGKLQWSWRTVPASGLSDATSYSDWTTEMPDPNALATDGAFIVRVRDEAGNVTAAASDPSIPAGGEAEGGSLARAGGVAAPPTLARPPSLGRAPAAGCGTAGGGAGFSALLLAGLLLVRRRRH